MMQLQRNNSLDALRGIAILGMILSGSIAYGDVLPAWMFHAQVPPPQHQFNPQIPGITWVDLVFPFFLFSMGAAIPLSLQKHISENKGFLFICQLALKRFALLAFFALFTQHTKAWTLYNPPSLKHHFISLLAFLLLFFQFYDHKKHKDKRIFIFMQLLALVAGICLLLFRPFYAKDNFDFYKSDIIIMVLANMAFFGTVIYYLTRNAAIIRLLILPFLAAIFLSAKMEDGGWAYHLFNFKQVGSFHFDWLYKFYFLKYLFIIIPATIIGDWFLKAGKITAPLYCRQENAVYILLCSVGLILINVYCLYERYLIANLIVTLVLLGCMYQLHTREARTHLTGKLNTAGTLMLLLGLSLEAYEGGIKKDPSTYSYYFVTASLACYTLIAFMVMERFNIAKTVIHYLSLNGRNAMVAYVAGNLLLLPLLSITGLKPFWDAMHQNALMGLLKGVLFTAVVSGITIFFVQRKWFWKT